MTIGFIGQGFVGKSYADEFEGRGIPVTRYSLEEPYIANKERIKTCDVVFIAVPTPTTPKGFDYSIVEAVLPLVGNGKTAVIRSTLLPGTTELLQKKFPTIIILHAPEFLSEVVAGFEVARPIMNIIGYPANSATHREQTTAVLSILPQARFSFVMTAREAEVMKYVHNIHGFMRVVFTNLMYDLAEKLECDWGHIRAAMEADPMMSPFYNNPIHKTGRGAGGHCFIKDFAAFRAMYEKTLSDPLNNAVLKALEEKNLALLKATNKDQDLVQEVYGIPTK
jgi:UDPglucose 6-dehydrogenase